MIRPDNELLEVANNKIYARRLQIECLQQFNDCLAQKGVVYGALMPDAHVGYVAPIGSAIVTDSRVYPQWVGVDIGCGITSTPTNFKLDDVLKNKRKIYRDLSWKSNINNNIVNPVVMPTSLLASDLSSVGRDVFNDTSTFGFNQLGTLGGGNHFVEIGADSNNMVWISVHSGSRGIGNRIARKHIKIARYNCNPREDEHPFLDVDSKECNDYLNDVRWLMSYAYINRNRIIDSVSYHISEYCKGGLYNTGTVDSNHSHIEITNKKYIHRKGCTQADKGEMVNIASNMRDGIYLCRGKGEHSAVYSCSHGAGRYCSRTKAKELLSVSLFEKDMDGIVCNVSEKMLDESPRAYKDIESVMSLQSDMVHESNHITPFINFKK